MKIRSTVLLGLWLVCQPTLAFAAEATVVLDTGRRVRGEIVADDSKADVLTLNQKRPGAMLVWHGNWNRVRTANVDGVEMTGTELRDRFRRDETSGVIENSVGIESARVTTPAVRLLPANHTSPRDLPGIPVTGPVTGPRLPTMSDMPPTGFATPWFDDGLCGRGVVIGFRDDPLSGYPDLEGRQFPYGVPLSERGYARDLFRNTRAIDVYGPPSFVGPVPLPALGARYGSPSSVLIAPGLRTH
jgi:hypothetical protein